MDGTAIPAMHRLGDFTGVNYDKGRSALWQAAWFATQHLVFSSWWLPARFRPPVLRAFGARIGRGVLIRNGVRVQWPWKLRIGDHSWIGEGAWLLNLELISIGSNVCISQEAFLCTGSHRHYNPTFEFDNRPVIVRDSAWVAARALVLRGVTIGEGALIAAQAVVTKDVPAGARIPAGGMY